LRENADIASISVWGGEENTPAVYGKVYISVKPTNGTVISSDKKNAIKGLLKRYNVLSIDPEFVDASYLYINPNIKARYNPDLTTLSASGVQTKIINQVSKFEDNNLGTFDNKRFRFSQFAKEMDRSDDSILSNETIIKLEKRFAPSTTTSATYTLAFNNSFHHPHEGHASVITSTEFTFQGNTCKFDDDGYGNIRIYYVDVAQNANVYLDRTAGEVDYKNGTVTFNGFLPTAFTGSEISIIANPNSNDVTALRNQIMLIAGATVTVINDASEVIAANTITATTSGVTTTTTESGIYSTVY